MKECSAEIELKKIFYEIKYIGTLYPQNYDVKYHKSSNKYIFSNNMLKLIEWVTIQHIETLV